MQPYNLKLDTPAVGTAGTTFTYIPLADTSALCLDGSQYGIFVCAASPDQWTLNIQGGGWCYDEPDCLGRAGTALGSSKTWPAEAAKMGCDPSGTMSYVNLYYCDGASFTGYREQPWPVPGTNSTLMFRGIRNLDASLDFLIAKYNINKASLLVLTGGSAGGLSTFLHLDHVAARLPGVRVVGEPVCGFFLDHPQAYGNASYSDQMQYVYNMQNSTGSLSTACQSALAPQSWKCIMAPHAAPFINTPWFALQSRFDHWQLSEILFLPCMQAQNYGPPFKPSQCAGTPQDADIEAYGPAFMEQFRPLMTGSKNGVFLDACIIHGSTNSSIDGANNYEAFQLWLQGSTAHSTWWTYKCDGSDSTGPCDPSPICAPFP